MKRSNPTRVLGAVGLTAVLLFAGACSSDEKADEKKDDAKETTTTAASDAPPAEMSDDEFSAGLTAFSEAMAAAGTDICAMSEAQALVPQSTPANEQQMKETIEVYTEMLRSYATAVADDATTAATLNTTADQLEAAAEEAGYPKDFLNPENPEDAPAVLSSPEYMAASEAMSTRFTAQCAPPEGAVDPGAEAPAESTETTVAP